MEAGDEDGNWCLQEGLELICSRPWCQLLPKATWAFADTVVDRGRMGGDAAERSSLLQAWEVEKAGRQAASAILEDNQGRHEAAQRNLEEHQQRRVEPPDLENVAIAGDEKSPEEWIESLDDDDDLAAFNMELERLEATRDDALEKVREARRDMDASDARCIALSNRLRMEFGDEVSVGA